MIKWQAALELGTGAFLNRLLVYFYRVPLVTFVSLKSILYCILNEWPCRTFKLPPKLPLVNTDR